MSKFSALMVAITSLILQSCGSGIDKEDFYSQSKNRIDFKDSLTLKEVKTITFPLDSTIGLNNRSICCFNKNDNSSVISILNLLNQSVYLYDYQTQKLLRKIKLQKEGPNGVGRLTNASAHLMDNIDTLFVLNYSQQVMYMLGTNGERLRKYDLKEKSMPVPCPSTVNRMIRVGHKLIIPSHVNSNLYTEDSKSSSLIVLDLLILLC